MTITDVKNKVISDAEEKALEIKSESDRKIKEIEDVFRLEKEKMEGIFIAENIKKLEDNKRSFLSMVGREIKLRRENVKREEIENILGDTLHKLENISDQEFMKFVEKIIKQLPKNLNGKILFSGNKSKFFEGLLKEHPSLFLKEDDSAGVGFLVEGDDFLYDFTFKNLLELKKSDLELYLSKILF